MLVFVRKGTNNLILKLVNVYNDLPVVKQSIVSEKGYCYILINQSVWMSTKRGTNSGQITILKSWQNVYPGKELIGRFLNL